MRKKTRERQKRNHDRAAGAGLHARLSEQLLIDRLPELLPTAAEARILCTSLGRAQFATAAHAHAPNARVECHFLNLFESTLAARDLGAHGPNLQLITAPDFATGPYDLAVLPTARDGDAELTRDLLQSAYQRLADGGQLWTATDTAGDSWLEEVLERMFDKVTRWDSPDGTVYRAVKTGPLDKVKHYDCEYVFRDGERLFRVYSRPGVFAHRRIDAGCRQLLNAMVIQPGQRVVDLGCGPGAVSLAAAAQQPTAEILALDCHTRAVECTERNAALNELPNIRTALTTLDDVSPFGKHDVVITNPPYFGQGEIVTRFLHASAELLEPDGQVLIVTKTPNWYTARMEERFNEIEVFESKKYWLVTGRKVQ